MSNSIVEFIFEYDFIIAGDPINIAKKHQMGAIKVNAGKISKYGIPTVYKFYIGFTKCSKSTKVSRTSAAKTIEKIRNHAFRPVEPGGLPFALKNMR